MGRIYTQKENRCKWTRKTLEHVVPRLTDGTISVRKAASEYHIPRRTLRNIMQKWEINVFLLSIRKDNLPACFNFI